jgi:tRNA G18 (ribose-2'-O)-methylase SpoU
MKPAIALENIRSAYNVGNLIRTADWLWFNVILLGYSPNPLENQKVLKTSLWAEKNVNLKAFYNVKKWMEFIKNNFDTIIAAEITQNSIPLTQLKIKWNFCIILGNEKEWITPETLEISSIISHIPMNGIKNSLNVCEAGSIFMWHTKNCLNFK